MARQYALWIVEDDPIQLDGIAAMLRASKLGSELQIEALAGEGALLAALEEGACPDIVMMDINLGADSLSGVDLVEAHFAQASVRIIYTTAYIGCVTSAYRTDHCYLLAKPIKPEQLELALEKALGSLQAEEAESLTFAVGTCVKNIPCSSIAWLESYKHRVEIHSASGVHSTYESMQAIVKRLPSSFAQTHKSYVVNLNKAFELRKGEVELQDGSVIPVSRHYQRAVRESLMTVLGIASA